MIFYEQEKYSPIKMEVCKGNLELEQNSLDIVANIEETQYLVISNPFEFIGKILEVMDADNNKRIYKRIRDIEKKIELLKKS